MIEYNARFGELLGNAYREAINIAERENDVVHFSGNGIDFYANKDSLPSLVEKYLEKCYRYDITSLGPEEPEWTEKFIKEKEEEYRIREAERRKQWDRLIESEKEDYQKFLDFVGEEEIEVHNQSDLEELRNANSGHFYGRAYTAFLEDIAKYLQVVKRINGKITHEDVVTGEKLIRKHGITGFQHSCIVSVLQQIWKHWEDGLF